MLYQNVKYAPVVCCSSSLTRQTYLIHTLHALPEGYACSCCVLQLFTDKTDLLDPYITCSTRKLSNLLLCVAVVH